MLGIKLIPRKLVFFCTARFPYHLIMSEIIAEFFALMGKVVRIELAKIYKFPVYIKPEVFVSI